MPVEDNQRRNPFPVLDAAGRTTGWKWYDEIGCECDRTYPSQLAALKDMLEYIEWLNHGPTLWQRVWWPIRYTLWPKVREFIHS